MVIAIINNKGGTGKTTTCVNLAGALAAANFKVLLVDLDSQASASFSLGIGWDELNPSVTDMLFNGMTAKEVIRVSEPPVPDIITADMSLASSDLMMADMAGRENRLAESLEAVQDQYDFILCDCPPSLSLISINALMVADSYIVPLAPEYLALEGLVGMMNAVELMRTNMGMSAGLLGIVFTLVNTTLKSTRQIMDIVRNHYENLVFHTEIKRDVKLMEAPAFSQTIFEFAPKSRGADSYSLLAREVIRRCGMTDHR